MSSNLTHCFSCGQKPATGNVNQLCPQCLLKAALDPLDMPTEAISQKAPEPSQPIQGSHPDSLAGTSIGRYKLLQELGEGGFGIVYLAQQNEPVKRRVALKIIKPGMDSREVIARFEAERQTLALMDHPNIAQVFDGGTTESGRPYFVMELVKGVPITQYCNDQHLNTRQRLELFLDVLAAVHHAHQKGIIHRDLKPSNILVSPHDGRPVVKVIDFGIAKALNCELTNKTLFTLHGALVGTFEYMSPEQAELNALDVDTRSDLYSLGVVLYELLTSRTPLDSHRLRQSGYAEIQRMIRDEEPQRPSARVGALGEALITVAEQRDVEPLKLPRLIQGDLDWIVMKALAKERGHRYETALGFANDIRRHLAEEPVLAGPPSQLYRLRKLMRRRKGTIAATAVVAASLMVGSAVSIWQALEARAARNQARLEAADAVGARNAAQKEAAISEAVLEFIKKDLFGSTNPGPEGDRELRLPALVDRAAARIEGRLHDQPLVEAAIQLVLTDSYRSLGQFEKALRHAQRSMNLRIDKLGANHADTMASRSSFACVLADLGRNEEAEQILRAVADFRRRSEGPEHPDSLDAAEKLAAVLVAERKHEEAEMILRDVVKVRTILHGAGDPMTLATDLKLTDVLRLQGKYPEAETQLRASLQSVQQALGPVHPDVLKRRLALADFLRLRSRNAEAESEIRSVIALQKEHPGTNAAAELEGHDRLAEVLRSQGKFSEAAAEIRAALETSAQTLGAHHLETLKRQLALGENFRSLGQLEDARSIYEETLKNLNRVAGPEHSLTLLCHSYLAFTLQSLRSFEAAESHLRMVIETQTRLLGKTHASTLENRCKLATLWQAAGKHAEAEAEHRAVMTTREQLLGKDHPDVLRSSHYLADSLRAQARYAEAEAAYRAIIEARTRVLGPEHPDTLNTRAMLATVLANQAKYAEAEKENRELVQICERFYGKDHPATLLPLYNLALCMANQGMIDDGLILARRALDGRRKSLGAEHPDTQLAARLYESLSAKN